MNPLIAGSIIFLIFGGIGAKAVIDTSLIPTTYDELFKKYGSQYRVPWLMLKRICKIESDIGRAKSVVIGLKNPNDIEGSKSFDGKSWGIMQVTLPTAKQFDAGATEAKLNNPEYSVKIAAQYLQWVMSRFPTTDPRYVEWVVKSYNQGVGNTSNERAGKSSGFAADYWAKYQKWSKLIS